jgi:hypothetical protein
VLGALGANVFCGEIRMFFQAAEALDDLGIGIEGGVFALFANRIREKH